MGCSVIILADNYNRATTPTTKALRRKGRSKGFVTDLLLSHCCGPPGAEPGQPYERDRGRWAGLRARAGVPGAGGDGGAAGLPGGEAEAGVRVGLEWGQPMVRAVFRGAG